MVIYVCTTITIRSCRECLGREQKIVHSTKYYSNVAWSGFSDFAAKTPAFQQSIAAVALDSSHRLYFNTRSSPPIRRNSGKPRVSLSLSLSLYLWHSVFISPSMLLWCKSETDKVLAFSHHSPLLDVAPRVFILYTVGKIVAVGVFQFACLCLAVKIVGFWCRAEKSRYASRKSSLPIRLMFVWLKLDWFCDCLTNPLQSG